MAIGDWTAYLTAAKTALDLFKGIRTELPNSPATEKIQRKIDEAEQALRISEAEMAKAFGYTLCECTFPPEIMLWREDKNAHVCRNPECGRRVEAASKKVAAGKHPSGLKCPYCGDDTVVTKIAPHKHFAFAGWKLHTLQCVNCEKKLEQPWEPKSGYELKT